MGAIGHNLRTIRRRRELSLNDLARRSGFSKGFLSKIENGRAQPPIATLMRLAGALDTGLNELFDGPRPDGAPDSVLTRAGEREYVPHSRERGYAFERLALASPFRLTPYVIHLAEEQEAPAGFQHAGEEFILVLAGELDYAVGGRVHRMREGDSLVFDATRPHGPIKVPGVSASFLAVFAGDRG